MQKYYPKSCYMHNIMLLKPQLKVAIFIDALYLQKKFFKFGTTLFETLKQLNKNTLKYLIYTQ